MSQLRFSTKLSGLVALALVLFFWIFWNPISSHTIEWYFKKKIQKELESIIQLENATWDNGVLLLNSPSMISRQENLPYFYAEQIALSYDFSLWQRKIHLKLQVLNPIFTINSKTEMLLKAILNGKTIRFKYFSLQWELSIPNGILQNKEFFIPFSLEIASSKESRGEFSLQLKNNIPQQPLKGEFFSETSGKRTIDLIFNQTPFSILSKGFRLLNLSPNELQIDSGIVHGHSQILFSKRQPLQLRGELTFTDIAINEPTLKFTCNIPKATLTFLPNSKETLGQFEIHKPFSISLGGFKQELLAVNAELRNWAVDAVAEVAEQRDQYAIKLGFDLDLLGMRNGWFKGDDFPMGKFIKPFFTNDHSSLDGTISFQGTFDPKALSIQYQTNNLHFENQHFYLTTTPQDDLPNEIMANGTHLFDFVNNESSGELHLKGGRYFDKKNRLLCTDIATSILFKEGKIEAPQFEGNCCDLCLNGALKIDSPLPDHFNLNLALNDLTGTVFNFQRLLSQLELLNPLTNLPLQGNIYLTTGPHHLNFTFAPTGYDLEANFSGSLSEGKLDVYSEDYTLQEIGFDFQFDHKGKSLLCSNLQGSLFLGKPEEAEEYTFSGNYIHFKHLPESQAEFDIAFIDKNNDELLRLIGNIHQEILQKEGFLCIDIDKNLSHIQKTHFNRCELILNKQWQIDHFRVRFNPLLQDMSTALEGLSKTKIWRDLGIAKYKWGGSKRNQGALSVDLKYDQAQGDFIFNLKGSDLLINSHPIKKLSLIGKKQENVWSIEQLQLDHISIAADIVKENQIWKFPFLGLRWSPSCLVGLEGTYFADQKSFLGRIHLLELDLPTIKKVFPLAHLISEDQAKETFKRLKALGQVQIFQTEHGVSFNIEHSPYRLSIHSKDLKLSRGKLVLSNLLTHKLPSEINNSLQIDWTRTSQGLEIQKAMGSFEGLTIDVVKYPLQLPEERFAPMIGKMAIHFDQASNILPQNMRNFLKSWQIGGTYHFIGQWMLQNPDPKKHLFSFQGSIKGQNVHLNGYEFDSMQSDCVYTEDKIGLNNFSIKDQSGILHIHSIQSVLRDNNRWEATLENCHVSEWQPSLLRAVGSTPIPSPLIIKQLRIEKLKGFLDDPNSFTAKGKFDFNNRSRDTPLFVIPEEIIKRIGLDVSILTPTTGTLYFDLFESKICFTKFKDVYSEGGLSKFNLASNSLPSYMDLNGKLNLRIRMKHHNLFFKLAEHFILKIEGTVRKPIYFIRKQPRKERSIH